MTSTSPRRPPGRQVDLRDIAGDNRLCVEAKTRQEHLHLLRGRVCASSRITKASFSVCSHERKRCDFDHPPFNGFSASLLPSYHRGRHRAASDRGDLFLDIAGQKSELLSSLNGGPCENDPADLFFQERVYRHGHGEIGFSRARRSYPEYDVVFPDRIEIAFLIVRFGYDEAPLGRYRTLFVKSSLRIRLLLPQPL